MLLSTGGNQLRIDNLSDGKVLLRHVNTNESKQVSEFQLIDAIQSGLVQMGLNPTTASGTSAASATDMSGLRQESEAAVQVMMDKRQWIEALKRKGITQLVDEPWVRAAVNSLATKELANIRRFAISTLSEAERKVRLSGGDWTVLVPNHSQRGGRGKPRTDPRADALLGQILSRIAQEQGPIVKQKIIDELRVKIASDNLASPGSEISIPGASTISRRVDEKFGAYELCVRNHGRARANRIYRNNALSRDSAQFPLLVSEYDDTDCGVFLVDPRTGLPHGRAYLTSGVCQYSKVPLGFDLGHRPRSYESAIGAIADSFLPKDMGQPLFSGCAHPWIGYGAQGTILMDNARYNQSKSMEHRREEMQLILAGARPYGPTEKTAIEHFNKIVKQDFCTQLPGWRGDKGDPDSVKYGMSHAILTEDVFRRWFARWVTDQYLNKPGDDGFTPKQRWQMHFRHHRPAVRWSSQQIAFMRLRPLYLRFRENGAIETLKLRYWSFPLSALKEELGPQASVIVYQDYKDLTYIVVQHPRTKTLMRVDCVMDPHYVHGLTRYQQSLILRFARTLKITNPSMNDLVHARLEFIEYLNQLSRSPKLRYRKLAANAGDLSIPEARDNAKRPTQPPGETRIVEMTELESSLQELELVELDEDDQW